MRTLQDALNSITEQSRAIQQACAHNAAPAGRYTTAFLDSIHANPDPVHAKLKAARKRAGAPASLGVLDLIRDALPSEERMFKYVGEADDGAKKTFEKREGVATPLREQRNREKREGGGDADVLLRTADRLIKDYQSMPRARATIRKLVQANQEQLERIFELEIAIEAATSATSSGSAPMPTAPTPSKAKSARPRRDTDEALLMEEQALRALEKRLAPIRAARPPALDPSSDAPPPSRGGLANSPPIRAGKAASSRTAATPPQSPSEPNPMARSTRTPITSLAQSRPTRTPSKTPQTSNVNITNALVSQTPRAARPTIDRFSPLRFLGTPRAYKSDRSKSTLRESHVPTEDEQKVGRGIFSSQPRPSGLDASVNGAAGSGGSGGSVFGTPAVAQTAPVDDPEEGVISDTAAEAMEEDMDETVRFPRQSEAGDEAVPHQGHGASEDGIDATTESVADVEAEPEAPGMCEGVFVEHHLMRPAVAKITSTLGPIVRQGLAPDQGLNMDMRALVKHLSHLSRSNPDPPPSPSSASSSSHIPSDAALKPTPITQQGISLAHVLLGLLRSVSPTSTADAEGPVELGRSANSLKADLAILLRQRGWEESEEGALLAANKVMYGLVAKRAVRMDRKQFGKEGGKVILDI